MNFGEFEQSFRKLKEKICPEHFNDRLTKYLRSFEYPHENFQVIIPHRHHDFTLIFQNNRLKKITWGEHVFKTKEDSDIKKIVLKGLIKYRKHIQEMQTP